MTTSSNLPRLPLVDLTSHYLVHLDGIDTENQFRHLQGEPLMVYPSFEEFVDLCRENGSDPAAKVCAHVHEFDNSYRVLDADFCDEPDLKWLLPLPSFDAVAEVHTDRLVEADEAEKWTSEFGNFAFPSKARH
jgi:hypothetical protein